jgi:hypothetical protein
MAEGKMMGLLISALGGAVGALILRSALKVTGAVWTRLTPRATHLCAASGANPGEFDHCWGREVSDDASTTGRVWEHNWNKVVSHDPHVPMGEHTIYGPYVNDFGKPGFYRISFRLRGMNFPKTDDPVLALDVVQASFGTERVLRLLGQRIIKAKELPGPYQSFDIRCYASGTDVYEYRCAVFPHTDTVTSSGRIIRFDCVKVYSHPSILDIL